MTAVVATSAGDVAKAALASAMLVLLILLILSCCYYCCCCWGMSAGLRAQFAVILHLALALNHGPMACCPTHWQGAHCQASVCMEGLAHQG